MADTGDLLNELAGHLEAAAQTVRSLAAAVDANAPSDSAGDPPESETAGAIADISAEEWVDLARELHPALGDRQSQVLGEVAKVHPRGVGTGPIWRAIKYEQTNTYLALDALARQRLVRKDDAAKPHQYFLGPALLRHGALRKAKS